MNLIRQLIYDKNVELFLNNKEIKLGSLSLIQEISLYFSYASILEEPLIIVKENSYQAQLLFNSLSLLMEDVYLYDRDELLRVMMISSSKETYHNNLKTLNKIYSKQVKILITTISSLMFYIPTKDIGSKRLIFKNQDIINIDQLTNQLISMGYHKKQLVEEYGDFSIRGGIIDIFSIGHEYPIRIDLFDNIIENLYSFDCLTQRRLHKVDELNILNLNLYQSEQSYNYQEIFDINDDNYEYLLSYLNHGNNSMDYPFFALSNDKISVFELFDEFKLIWSNYERSVQIYDDNLVDNLSLLYEKKLIINENIFIDTKTLLHKYDPLIISQFEENTGDLLRVKSGFKVTDYENTLLGYTLKYRVVCLLNHNNYLIVTKFLSDKEIEFNTNNNQIERLNIFEGNFDLGFISDDILVITDHELFNEKKKGRYYQQFKQGISLSGISQLQIDDYVVHRNYGIARYCGLVTKEIDGKKKDFLKLLFSDDNYLLVPLYQFNLVKKYVSSSGLGIKLSKLGSSVWKKTRQKLETELINIADQLATIYSQRKQQKGFSFSKNEEIIKNFSSEFEYQLTKDQEIAINEIFSDMESELPMDRLLCGDVGFGKTEVAIQAAFKAILDNKQVVLLCPTTLLSLQHFQTFIKRFKNYPINIEVLNRFISPIKVKDIIDRTKKGQVDILIGTHRVLSKDVNFYDLGLLIIDEEQRFGVLQKEKIKELKVNIDVLSLSATPIPRSLQLSLLNVRSLSQINTPPNNRLPVMVRVIDNDNKLIYGLIDKEIIRGGQVFYLYNHTVDIYKIAYKLKQRFPDVNIGVAHGKMSKNEIEDIMIDFRENKISILVCTTIIETGIDIPNANTIIIDQAYKFGLSQLYQIKGRVGRSDTLAYAYLVIDKNKQLKSEALRRIEAIKEFASLGSGYKIAMRDLSIRGAGELLGANQSGFIDSVGIDLYLELLDEVINRQKYVNNDSIDIEIEGYIPDSYTNDSGLKIDIYQKLNACHNLYDLLELEAVMLDRYGKMDNSTKLLFLNKKLSLLLNNGNIERFINNNDYYEIVFKKEISDNINGEKVFKIMSEVSLKLILRYKLNMLRIILNKTQELEDVFLLCSCLERIGELISEN